MLLFFLFYFTIRARSVQVSENSLPRIFLQSPNPSYASPFLHKKMYLPLIKLSLVFEFFSKLSFVKGTEDELEKKLKTL